MLDNEREATKKPNLSNQKKSERKTLERCVNPSGGIYKIQYDLRLLSVVRCQPQAAMESPRCVVAATDPYQYPRQHPRS